MTLRSCQRYVAWVEQMHTEVDKTERSGKENMAVRGCSKPQGGRHYQWPTVTCREKMAIPQWLFGADSPAYWSGHVLCLVSTWCSTLTYFHRSISKGLVLKSPLNYSLGCYYPIARACPYYIEYCRHLIRLPTRPFTWTLHEFYTWHCMIFKRSLWWLCQRYNWCHSQATQIKCFSFLHVHIF